MRTNERLATDKEEDFVSVGFEITEYGLVVISENGRGEKQEALATEEVLKKLVEAHSAGLI